AARYRACIRSAHPRLREPRMLRDLFLIAQPPLGDAAVQEALLIPRLSKAGMPSRSEGWGGLFKDEQYRLIRSASRHLFCRTCCSFFSRTWCFSVLLHPPPRAGPGLARGFCPPAPPASLIGSPPRAAPPRHSVADTPWKRIPTAHAWATL